MHFLTRRFLLVSLAFFATFAVAAERTTYFVPDAQGSPVAAMDERGNVIWRETYAPYGARQNRAAANDGKTAYTGKPEDTATGLVYMGARWYDPETARFTGMDPQGFSEGNPQSFGRYLYGNNSPYVYSDPNGEVPVLAPLAVFMAKEGAGFVFESTTGLPAVFSMKGLAKAIKPDGHEVAAKASKSNGTVLWSGSAAAKNEAAAFADSIGGKTLETTDAGKRLIGETAGMAWDKARTRWAAESTALVERAEGVVDVFLAKSGVRQSSIFISHELPAAKTNTKVTGLRIHPAGAAQGKRP